MAVEMEEVLEFLEAQQIELPESLVKRLVARVNSKSECFEKHGYSEDDIYFITIYMVALLGLVSYDGRIRSQAANGASRSFAFGTLGERWKSLTGLLNGVDPNGCVNDLIPPNPDKKAYCAIFVSPGVPGACR